MATKRDEAQAAVANWPENRRLRIATYLQLGQWRADEAHEAAQRAGASGKEQRSAARAAYATDRTPEDLEAMALYDIATSPAF